LKVEGEKTNIETNHQSDSTDDCSYWGTNAHAGLHAVTFSKGAVIEKVEFVVIAFDFAFFVDPATTVVEFVVRCWHVDTDIYGELVFEGRFLKT
jgi:hypothetical protein